MLVSVWSDKFRNNAQVRPPIMFHPGLNTVRGGQSAQNSIGKSTLLFIVDYAFGGSTFAKSKAVSAKAEGAHTIYFTFRFNDVDYYFSRTTNVPGFVQTYEDPEYKNPAERWEFDEYVGWLKHQYGLSGMDASFRQIVTRFARIQQKALSNVETPLQGPGREPVATGLAVMRQLFGVYDYLKELEQALTTATENLKAVQRTQKIGVFQAQKLRLKRDYTQAVKHIHQLESELDAHIKGADQAMLELDVEHSDQAATIKSHLHGLRIARGRLKAKIQRLTQSLNEDFPAITDPDLAQLQVFFPDADLERIEDVQLFHRTITEIVSDEVEDQITAYQLELGSLTTFIGEAEQQLRDLNVPIHVSEKELRRNAEIGGHLALVKEQVEAWEATQDLKSEKKDAEARLNDTRKSYDREIETKLNAEIARLDRFIHKGSGDWYPPVFTFSDTGKSYTYGSEVDDGTGTTGKNLILFDLAMLELTALPYVIHDHPLHQSIEDATVGRILKLYQRFTNKQIFIAFDKDEHYAEAPEVNTIVTQTAVIELGKEHEALYGWTWNKKPSKNPKQEEGTR